MKRELGILLLLVTLCLIVTFLNPRFLSAENLQNIARLIGAFGILSIGSALVIISGGIDLSVGSMMALLGVILTIAINKWHFADMACILLVMIAASVLGLLQGILIARLRLQAFIVTLCGLLIYRGTARFLVSDETRGFSSASGVRFLHNIGTGNTFGIPSSFILMIVISLIMAVVLHRSVYGRYLFATGRNEVAARHSGVNTTLVLTGVYIIGALLTSISAIIVAFYTNSISPSSHGNFYELYGIAAAVLGGCSLRGGEGSIGGVLIGTALLQVLQNLVNLLGIPSSLDFTVMGSVILAGVIADQLLRKRGGKSSRTIRVIAVAKEQVHG